MEEVFVVYYDPTLDEMFQSKMPAVIANLEKKRVLYAPNFMYITFEHNPRIPIRDIPDIAKQRSNSTTS